MGGDQIIHGKEGQKNEERDHEAFKSEISCSVNMTGQWDILKKG
jgi:hypothetical protein